MVFLKIHVVGISNYWNWLWGKEIFYEIITGVPKNIPLLLYLADNSFLLFSRHSVAPSCLF